MVASLSQSIFIKGWEKENCVDEQEKQLRLLSSSEQHPFSKEFEQVWDDGGFRQWLEPSHFRSDENQSSNFYGIYSCWSGCRFSSVSQRNALNHIQQQFISIRIKRWRYYYCPSGPAASYCFHQCYKGRDSWTDASQIERCIQFLKLIDDPTASSFHFLQVSCTADATTRKPTSIIEVSLSLFQW